jgi:hypothetical protein
MTIKMDSLGVENSTNSAILSRKPTAPPKKEIWSALLKSVASGKRLSEKQLLVLGKMRLGSLLLHVG